MNNGTEPKPHLGPPLGRATPRKETPIVANSGGKGVGGRKTAQKTQSKGEKMRSGKLALAAVIVLVATWGLSVAPRTYALGIPHITSVCDAFSVMVMGPPGPDEELVVKKDGQVILKETVPNDFWQGPNWPIDDPCIGHFVEACYGTSCASATVPEPVLGCCPQPTPAPTPKPEEKPEPEPAAPEPAATPTPTVVPTSEEEDEEEPKCEADTREPLDNEMDDSAPELTGPERHSFEYPGDRDWVKLWLNPGDLVQLQAEPPWCYETIPVLRLFDQYGNLIEQNVQRWGNIAEVWYWYPSDQPAGWFYVEISELYNRGDCQNWPVELRRRFWR